MKKKPPPIGSKAFDAASFDWGPRADPAKLKRFDPRSKICTMNCSQATGDPRSKAECKLLCDDCLPNFESDHMIFTGDTIPTAPPRRSRYLDAAGVFFEFDGKQWNQIMLDTFKAAVYLITSPLPQMIDLENDLPPLQKVVGGYLETVALAGGLLLVCNEDGNTLDIGRAWAVCFPGQNPQPIAGNFFVCRREGEEFASLQDGDADALAKIVRPIVGGAVV